ncbi:MAG: ABC transporter permease [Clostridia bacterium]|nr:ABC transporter permease [Clostridia bacterium]
MKKKNLFLSRRLTGRYASLWVSILAVLMMFATAGILLLVIGKNPLDALRSFLQGCGILAKENYGGGSGQLTDLLDFLSFLAPMILASLSFITAFKAGLFNIGISGQMLLSGFVATVLVGYNKDLSATVARPAVLLIGLLVGGLTGVLVGFLKYRFNIHEVVSTIMINYIISYLTGFMINSNYVDMMTRNSKVCSPESRLTLTNVMIGDLKCKIPLALIAAILVAVLVSFLFRKTVLGFEIKAVGQNRRCSEYTGIRVSRTILLSMGLSGAIAGLAGVAYYLGYTNSIVPKSLPGMGYDSISVALLGNSAPIGSIFAAVIVSIFQQGANYMSSSVGVAKEIASLITGILLLFAACGNYMRYRAERKMQQAADSMPDQGASAKAEDQNGKEAKTL